MANSLDRQITEEGPRNAIVKLTGVLDTNDITEAPAIALSDFKNNDSRMQLTGLRADMLEYSIAQGLEVLLYWHSATPKLIYPLARAGRIFSWSYGGFLPDPLLAGYTGDIDLVTKGFVPGSTMTFVVVLELIKLYA